MHNRLEQQLIFIREIDKVKQIFRQTRLLDNSRCENDAEHAWHLGMMALVLAEYANEPVEISKVINMVLLHDIVEIDAGDTFLYDVDRIKKQQEERQAAKRIFGLLPKEQAGEMQNLWEEFEARKTPEARFAAALDRLEPILQNISTGGYAWKKHGIKRSQVQQANAHIAEGSHQLWELVTELMDQADKEGLFTESEAL